MLWFFDENGLLQLTGAGFFSIPIFIYLFCSLFVITKEKIKTIVKSRQTVQ